jgi:formylglycine-generating enzyme required for sulfatase activity
MGRINGDNIRNYVQLIAVDKVDGTIAGFHEVRRTSATQAQAALTLYGLVCGHTYGILLLQGHWERDYAKETGGNYAYTGNPPTLLSAGYKEVTFSGGGAVTIAVWPIYMDTVFTAGGLRVAPIVNAGKPGAASLLPAPWIVNWKVVRGASGTASGFGDLVTAQNAAGFPGDSLIARSLKAAARADGYGEAAPTPALTGHTVTLSLTDYTALSRVGKVGSANFALSFAPFNLTEGWARYDAVSVFDLESGPPEWVIRNGLNDLPQDGNTDFTNFGNVPVTEANGNGAVRFTVTKPLPAATGELVVSDGSWAEPFVTFTTSGYTGTAQAWYAAVPANAGYGDVPGYTAYTPLGDIPAGTHTKPVTLSGTDGDGYNVYVILVKDGKAGAPHRITIGGETGKNKPAGTIVHYSVESINFSMMTVPDGTAFPTGIDDRGRETVENAFMIGETEVPYALWNTVRTWAQNKGYSVSAGQAGRQKTEGEPDSTQEPVTSITWYDAVVWCNALTEWLNDQTGTSLKPVYYYRQGGSLCKNSVAIEAFVRENAAHQFGSVFAESSADGFRLPASKEWELAARWQGSAVNTVNGWSNPYFCKGNSASGAQAAYIDETMDETATPDEKEAATRAVAVYNKAKTAKVASKRANGLGLFDMSGNVYEWCYEWKAGGEGRLRVIRGGSIIDLAYYMQIGLAGFAATDAHYTDIGFRLVRSGNE